MTILHKMICCLTLNTVLFFTNAYAYNDDIYIDSDYDIYVNNVKISDQSVPSLKSPYQDKLFVQVEPIFSNLDCLVAYCPSTYTTPVFDIFTPAGELIRLSENPDNLNIGATLDYYSSYLDMVSTTEFHGNAVFWHDNTAYIALQDLIKIYNISVTYDNNAIFIQKEYEQHEPYIDELKKYIDSESFIDGNCIDYLRMKNSNPEKTFDNIINIVNAKTSNEVGCSVWALKDINRAIEKHILHKEICNGYIENINRYDFSIIVYNLLDKTTNIFSQNKNQSLFSDIDSIEINYLSNIGVINGKNFKIFSPNDKMTREEAATILGRMADYLSILPTEKQLSEYNDDMYISNWAKDNVYKVTSLKIMNDVGDNNFAPKELFTKEQAIVTIMRLYDMIQIN